MFKCFAGKREIRDTTQHNACILAAALPEFFHNLTRPMFAEGGDYFKSP